MLVDKQQSLKNKRYHIRRDIICPIALHIGGASFWQGKTMNVSNGGACVQVEETFEGWPGSPIGFWMGLEENQCVSALNGYKIPCTIVRARDKQVAVRFDDPSYALAQLNTILLANI